MQMSDKCLSLIVGLNHVFTLRRVLKDFSTVHAVEGRVSTIMIALPTAGNVVVGFTGSVIPRSYHQVTYASALFYSAKASSTRLPMQ